MSDTVDGAETPIETPEAMSAEDAGIYPPYELKAEQRERWDLCRRLAVYTSEQGEESGVADNTFVWLTTRALYRSDIPTGARDDSLH